MLRTTTPLALMLPVLLAFGCAADVGPAGAGDGDLSAGSFLQFRGMMFYKDRRATYIASAETYVPTLGPDAIAAAAPDWKNAELTFVYTLDGRISADFVPPAELAAFQRQRQPDARLTVRWDSRDGEGRFDTRRYILRPGPNHGLWGCTDYRTNWSSPDIPDIRVVGNCRYNLSADEQSALSGGVLTSQQLESLWILHEGVTPTSSGPREFLVASSTLGAPLGARRTWSTEVLKSVHELPWNAGKAPLNSLVSQLPVPNLTFDMYPKYPPTRAIDPSLSCSGSRVNPADYDTSDLLPAGVYGRFPVPANGTQPETLTFADPQGTVLNALNNDTNEPECRKIRVSGGRGLLKVQKHKALVVECGEACTLWAAVDGLNLICSHGTPTLCDEEEGVWACGDASHRPCDADKFAAAAASSIRLEGPRQSLTTAAR